MRYKKGIITMPFFCHHCTDQRSPIQVPSSGLSLVQLVSEASIRDSKQEFSDVVPTLLHFLQDTESNTPGISLLILGLFFWHEDVSRKTKVVVSWLFI